jgi:hypothetical protein
MGDSNAYADNGPFWPSARPIRSRAIKPYVRAIKDA